MRGKTGRVKALAALALAEASSAPRRRIARPSGASENARRGSSLTSRTVLTACRSRYSKHIAACLILEAHFVLCALTMWQI